ncbi:tetraacyldisaccharide 4'-kinase [Alienimonas californiensis]|uniref:tetraacyldisaccharide 4'-kinase n=1 Tax=Alienimonas californiensis TaxID=2527989 RepID=UPI001A97D585|nr:tetraacyldisaccharide 4'-kinase [Alienimonas californiensis]
MTEAAYLDLIAGRTRGPWAAALRLGLLSASLPYGLAVRTRNRAFDLGLKPVHRAGAPVISVGNLTCGGTGKTPIVADLCLRLQAGGRRPAALSRGYRSLEGEGANDEKLLLDALMPGVPQVQNPDRVAGAKLALQEHGADCLVLDDGFQHRRLGRDLDVALIDATAPFGPGSLRRPGCRGRVLPAGLLRESAAGLRRADLILLTRCDAITADERAAVESALTERAPGTPVVPVAFAPTALIDVAGAARSLDGARGARVGAFCGIGNPAGFRATLEGLGVDVATFEPRPDHHAHTPADVAAIAQRAADAGATALLCTEKDLVKLRTKTFAAASSTNPEPPLPIFAVRIAATYPQGDAALTAALTKAAGSPVGGTNEGAM